jgi:hypothetical protein
MKMWFWTANYKKPEAEIVMPDCADEQALNLLLDLMVCTFI